MPTTSADHRLPIGKALSLADRLDTLAGIFLIGQAPTGDKDPFALRRAALGALRIMIEGELDLDLHKLLKSTVDGFTEFPGMTRIERLEAAVDHLNRYRGQMRSQLPRDDPTEAYINEALAALEAERSLGQDPFADEEEGGDGAEDGEEMWDDEEWEDEEFFEEE